ncbi:hypothetical protein NEOLI_004582 [Neolecta irregularis DAH-3]|uniref:Uncharacterized protein n=1 Tax=Neolecta irregularis (strain DAH-3) TaxID=1198029 RepID=A0A1U7LTQ0_NEOID|nr:hypothetical protein NEOLI_004582 [Neolecta irregularis DAH-3]|eukprot:OLL25922.1 hypothetical protein NEOLI_004582 [Neolecta irregularis DAH-3]
MTIAQTPQPLGLEDSLAPRLSIGSSNEYAGSQPIPEIYQRLKNPEIFVRLHIPPSLKYKGDSSPEDLEQSLHAKDHLSAAIQSQSLIISTSTVKELFDYWQIRLSCLHILQQSEIVHTESRRINEVLSQSPLQGLGVPWNFQILLALSYPNHHILNELYRLVEILREEGSHISEDDTERAVIKHQLKEVSLYVGATLISLKDYHTAIKHFSSCSRISQDDFRTQLLTGLLYLQIGDSLRAEERFRNANDVKENCAIECMPLLSMVDSEWEQAVESWKKLASNNFVKGNCAVSLFFAGRLSESISLFQSTLSDFSDPYTQSLIHEQLVNLYELHNRKPPVV